MHFEVYCMFFGFFLHIYVCRLRAVLYCERQASVSAMFCLRLVWFVVCGLFGFLLLIFFVSWAFFLFLFFVSWGFLFVCFLFLFVCLFCLFVFSGGEGGVFSYSDLPGEGPVHCMCSYTLKLSV